MKIISVANRKGGVGKTVVSANLAHELARRGYVTLLLDLDPQCDLTKYCLQEQTDSGNVFQLLRRQCSIESCCVEVRNNLYLIPGSREINNLDARGSQSVLRRRLEEGNYLSEVDFVIVDHPPALSFPSLTGFTASDEVLIVSDAETFGVDNLGELLADLAQIQRSKNPNLHVMGMVVNKVDGRRSLVKAKLKELKRDFSEHIFSAKLSYNTAIPIAISQRVFLRELSWYSQPLRQLSQVTDEFLKRMERDHEKA